LFPEPEEPHSRGDVKAERGGDALRKPGKVAALPADDLHASSSVLEDRCRYLHFLRKEYMTARTSVEREVILSEWISIQKEVDALLR
jgi:hypothetical protein